LNQKGNRDNEKWRAEKDPKSDGSIKTRSVSVRVRRITCSTAAFSCGCR
jgi:hypothetical protein